MCPFECAHVWDLARVKLKREYQVNKYASLLCAKNRTMQSGGSPKFNDRDVVPKLISLYNSRSLLFLLHRSRVYMAKGQKISKTVMIDFLKVNEYEYIEYISIAEKNYIKRLMHRLLLTLLPIKCNASRFTSRKVKELLSLSRTD